MNTISGLFSEGLHLDPKNPDFYQNPYTLYETIHAQSAEQNHPGRAFYWHEYKLWCVYSFEAVNSILKDRRFGRQIPAGCSRAELGLPEPAAHLCDFSQVEAWSLLTLEPPDHTRIRKLVTRAFISRNIKQLRPDIEAFAQQLLDNVHSRLSTAGESVDLLTEYAAPLPARIISELIGVPVEFIPQLLDWSHRMVRVYTMTQTREEEISANTAAAEFSLLIKDLIRQRRASPQQDLLSHLVTGKLDTGKASDKLNDDEIVSTVILLLNAGHEATVHQFGNSVKTILECKHSPENLFTNDTQGMQTVEELMRYDTPLHLFTRYALEDVSLPGSLTLKRGQQVGLLLGAANRDPLRFSNPALFNPWRDDAGQVSLGAGIHYCVGAALAQLELHTGLSALFKQLPAFKIDGDLKYRDSYHFHGLQTLPISFCKKN